MTERLQKFLSRTGVSSRRKAEQLIISGRVSVNGVTVTVLGTKVNPERDVVCCDGERVMLREPRLFLFHKPTGVVTTLSDPQGRRTIADFTKRLAIRVYPVGRLDLNVSGLLVLTNDGDYAHELLHPRFGAEREYIAVVSGVVSRDALSHLKGGVQLDDGLARVVRVERCASADPRVVQYCRKIASDESVVVLVVKEGRHHFVKRILKAVGHPVRQLVRIRFGPHELGALKPGEIRELIPAAKRKLGAQTLAGAKGSQKRKPR